MFKTSRYGHIYHTAENLNAQGLMQLRVLCLAVVGG